MNETKIEALEKRIADLEKSMAQLLQGQPSGTGIVWKDWRVAVGKVARTELAEEVDAAGRAIREADRRETGS